MVPMKTRRLKVGGGPTKGLSGRPPVDSATGGGARGAGRRFGDPSQLPSNVWMDPQGGGGSDQGRGGCPWLSGRPTVDSATGGKGGGVRGPEPTT